MTPETNDDCMKNPKGPESYTERQVTHLLAILDDETKVAVFLNQRDLEDLIVACNGYLTSPRSKRVQNLRIGMEKLLLSAFSVRAPKD